MHQIAYGCQGQSDQIENVGNTLETQGDSRGDKPFALDAESDDIGCCDIDVRWWD